MKLCEMTWKEVDGVSREVVVLIPTGSLEQHGPHLPLFTDSILATAMAEALERELGAEVLLTPTIWLGASAHHLPFPGSMSASTVSYLSTLQSVIESLIPHGFHKFYVVNGHGGNTDLNSIALRELKNGHRELTFGHADYYKRIGVDAIGELKGRIKGVRHACEAETSLMMHVAPHLVRVDKIRDDGLESHPAVPGVVHEFDEITEEGSYGDSTQATADLGKRLFESALTDLTEEVKAIATGYSLRGR